MNKIVFGIALIYYSNIEYPAFRCNDLIKNLFFTFLICLKPVLVIMR